MCEPVCRFAKEGGVWNILRDYGDEGPWALSVIKIFGTPEPVL
jgi:hypothetical protein